MAIDVKVPVVGESVTEGTIARWLKKDGDFVRKDEPLFELETEKATQEIPAPADGTVRLAVKEGQTVPIGAVVARIEPGARPAEPKAEAAGEHAAPGPPVTASPAPPARETPRETPALSPAARRLAAEEQVRLAEVTPSGRHGVILKTDVQQYLERQAAEESPEISPAAEATSGRETPLQARETRQRMSAIRQRIAERLLASQKQTASLTTFNEADMSAVMDLRARYKDRFKEKHGVGLGFMSFFVKACVEALKAFPIVNARIEESEIVLPHYYNIGVAVSTEKGLMVPVLRDADRMTFAQIEKAVADLAVKARDGKITVADLQGGTFTITNGGVFGSMMSTPILNPPQSAILGMHTIQKRPVVRDDHIVIRPMMYLALTYDHRLIDGREAVQFLVRVKECVENPGALLLDI